ncbi:MAG: hypothetical protein GY696_25910 [Gammaproteobacteria bacterium]|nr:hypothetical protein [Gammaproteobacteria bacterium]
MIEMTTSVVKLLLTACRRSGRLGVPDGTPVQRLQYIVNNFEAILNTTSVLGELYGTNPTDLHVLLETLRFAGADFWTVRGFRYLRMQVVLTIYDEPPAMEEVRDPPVNVVHPLQNELPETPESPPLAPLSPTSSISGLSDVSDTPLEMLISPPMQIPQA